MKIIGFEKYVCPLGALSLLKVFKEYALNFAGETIIKIEFDPDFNSISMVLETGITLRSYFGNAVIRVNT